MTCVDNKPFKRCKIIVARLLDEALNLAVCSYLSNSRQVEGSIQEVARGGGGFFFCTPPPLVDFDYIGIYNVLTL